VTVTPKQREFPNQYLIDQNATAAAARAGYKNAEIGRQIITKHDVSEAIQKALAAGAESVKLDADYVICRLREEAEYQGEGSSPSARVKALELSEKHLNLFPLRGNLSLSLDGQVDVPHANLLEGRRVARRLILEEIRDESLVLPGDED